MSNVSIMTGNSAAAQAALLCGVQVVAAYPITPQSQLAEILSSYIEGGKLKAEYVRVEGEHSALTVCISASTVGARAFTATSANGLLYMHEQLHWAAGSRLPIVMCCANRGVGAPWTIFNDQQDSVSQRDTGWIQIYCRDNQEILDTVIQAYRIAEQVYLPVMVCYDGFVLSHTMMPVASPDASVVAEFLPPYKPQTVLSTDDPRCLNPVLFPWRRDNVEGVTCDGYMEMRRKLQNAMDNARPVIRDTSAEYARRFGRDTGGLSWTYRMEDADVVLVSMGSMATEATTAVDMLREKGIRAGVFGVRVFRPFPSEECRNGLQKAKAILVFEKDISYGHEGALCSDVKSALYGSGVSAPIFNVIAGLGGRDVKARELAAEARTILENLETGTDQSPLSWLNCAE